MKELIKKLLREDVNLPVNIGDTVLMGRFKNKKVVVKTVSWNEKGDLLINGRSAMRMRIIPQKPKPKTLGGDTVRLSESELVNLINRVITESKTTSKLKFNKQSRKKGAKTDVYNVVKGGTTIGQVKWYSRLRGYGFLPPSGDESEVTEFVKEISKTHREKNKKK